MGFSFSFLCVNPLLLHKIKWGLECFLCPSSKGCVPVHKATKKEHPASISEPPTAGHSFPNLPSVQDHERWCHRAIGTHSRRCHSRDSFQTLWHMFRDCGGFEKSWVLGPMQRWEGSAGQQVSRMLRVVPTCNKLRWSLDPMWHFSKFYNSFKFTIMHWPGPRHTPVEAAQEMCAYRAGTWVGGPGHHQASEWLSPA